MGVFKKCKNHGDPVLRRTSIVIIILGLCTGSNVATNDALKFPDNFMFGVTTAAYQVEGAWNVSGKGESIFDRWTHTIPFPIADKSNGDIAAASYYNYRQDVQAVREMGLDFYRFSLSWPRILPSGYTNFINPDGVAYYNNLINELIKYNIKPMVSIYHWDLPQKLEDIGGWSNPLIVDIYEDYARLVYSLFADRVPFWSTFSEPMQTCLEGYGRTTRAPALNNHGIGEYLCSHHLLLAHAKAYHIYDKEFRPKYKGIIGIAFDINWAEPATDAPEDAEAAEFYLQTHAGWYAHPIFTKEGNYYQPFIDKVDRFSKQQGYLRSRLPKFSKEEIEYIRGTSDYFGLNHYTTYLLQWGNGSDPIPSHENDVGIKRYHHKSWPVGSSNWLKVVPWGFRKLLNWIKDTYGNIPVMVTENGYSDDGEIHDVKRVAYHQHYLHALLQAINLDGCNVVAYAAWSLLDNFEWDFGYTEQFGLYHVDYSSPNRTRTPKYSSKVYADIVRNKTLPEGFDPTDLSIFSKKT